ncbi:malate dehydrogenase [Syntrophotalea acetylenica]|uniref:malate dehydrogenase n=1 Tax=Syntrophotalea acetylenica TaxID=29542 RepID=UPI002A362E8F|nr:malate dehydrogenase [Syntrophotalea acetylenica]MDY0261603.1 malate dehydrogenase [Syntrophotalea acetylenica]
MTKPKIALVGGGQIGNAIAHLAAMRELGDVVMFDIKENLARGKCLDIAQAAPISDFDVQLKGSDDIAVISGADIVVVTAGVPRKPGMSREDLIEINARIMATVAEGIRTHAPDAIVIVLSNPLDAMVTLCQKITGFSTNRVMGMAGVLDSARFAFFIARELGVSVRDVNALVLGGHGDAMVPIVRFANVNGIPALELLKHKFGSEEKAHQIMASLVARTRDAGGEVVELLQTGSAFVSPATSAVAMIEAVIHDQKRLLPVCAMLDGQFGVSGYYVGVPCILGVEGVERIIEFELTADERRLLDHSVGEVRKLVDNLPL